MGTAAMILGIISLMIGFIPVCGIIALLPAIIGLILGIIEVSKKKKTGEPKGKGVAGVICSALAIVIIIVYSVLAGLLVKRVSDDADLYNAALNASNSIKEMAEQEMTSSIDRNTFYDTTTGKTYSILDFIGNTNTDEQ